MTILIKGDDGITSVNDSEYNTRDKLTSLIGENHFTVNFTKKDGTNRIMSGTRNLNKIPQDKRPKNNRILDHKDIVTVFDLNNDGWRSFNINNVNEITIYQK